MARSIDCKCTYNFTCGYCLRNAKPWHWTPTNQPTQFHNELKQEEKPADGPQSHTPIHQYAPRRKDGKCKYMSNNGSCHLPEDAPVHTRWVNHQNLLIAHDKQQAILERISQPLDPTAGQTSGLALAYFASIHATIAHKQLAFACLENPDRADLKRILATLVEITDELMAIVNE